MCHLPYLLFKSIHHSPHYCIILFDFIVYHWSCLSMRVVYYLCCCPYHCSASCIILILHVCCHYANVFSHLRYVGFLLLQGWWEHIQLHSNDKDKYRENDDDDDDCVLCCHHGVIGCCCIQPTAWHISSRSVHKQNNYTLFMFWTDTKQFHLKVLHSIFNEIINTFPVY